MSKASRDKGAREEWRDVVTCDGMYSDIYEVSNLGRIRRHINCRGRGCQPGHILNAHPVTGGYYSASLYKEQKRKSVKVHRIVADSFLGERPEGYVIDHISGDKSDNSAANLEYVPQKENCRRAIEMGLYDPSLISGHNKHVGLKIDLAGARAIRRRAAEGESRADLASEYGIHVMTVGEIVRGEIWAE